MTAPVLDATATLYARLDTRGRRGVLQRLPVALLSGLPNEEDWAFRALTVVSYNDADPSVVRPWLSLLMDKTAFFSDSQSVADVLFGGSAALDWDTRPLEWWREDINGQGDLLGLRLVQTAEILRNLVLREDNVALLAAESRLVQFLLRGLAAHNALARCADGETQGLWSSIYRHRVVLHAACLETLHRVAAQIRFVDIAVGAAWLLDHCRAGLESSDRAFLIGALGVLGNLCSHVDNYAVMQTLDDAVLRQMNRVLLMPDIPVLLAALETLYQLSNVPEIAERLTTINHIIRTLVCLLDFNLDTFEDFPLEQAYPVDVKAIKHLTSDADYERCVWGIVHWLSQFFEQTADVNKCFYRADIYNVFCKAHAGRVVLDVATFGAVLRRVFPKVHEGTQPSAHDRRIIYFGLQSREQPSTPVVGQPRPSKPGRIVLGRTTVKVTRGAPEQEVPASALPVTSIDELTDPAVVANIPFTSIAVQPRTWQALPPSQSLPVAGHKAPLPIVAPLLSPSPQQQTQQQQQQLMQQQQMQQQQTQQQPQPQLPQQPQEQQIAFQQSIRQLHDEKIQDRQEGQQQLCQQHSGQQQQQEQPPDVQSIKQSSFAQSIPKVTEPANAVLFPHLLQQSGDLNDQISQLDGHGSSDEEDNDENVGTPHASADLMQVDEDQAGSATTGWSCPREGCPVKFASGSALQRHLGSLQCQGQGQPQLDCAPGQVRVCEWASCGRRFALYSEFAHHMATEHITSEDFVFGCQWSGCLRHGEIFSSRLQLLTHGESHMLTANVKGVEPPGTPLPTRRRGRKRAAESPPMPTAKTPRLEETPAHSVLMVGPTKPVQPVASATAAIPAKPKPAVPESIQRQMAAVAAYNQLQSQWQEPYWLEHDSTNVAHVDAIRFTAALILRNIARVPKNTDRFLRYEHTIADLAMQRRPEAKVLASLLSCLHQSGR